MGKADNPIFRSAGSWVRSAEQCDSRFSPQKTALQYLPPPYLPLCLLTVTISMVEASSAGTGTGILYSHDQCLFIMIQVYLTAYQVSHNSSVIIDHHCKSKLLPWLYHCNYFKIVKLQICIMRKTNNIITEINFNNYIKNYVKT